MASAADNQFEFFQQWLTSDRPNSAGEYRMLCPLHNEQRPSASINFSKGLFNCMNPSCMGGMSIRRLKQEIIARREADPGEQAAYDPLVGDSNVVDIKTRKQVPQKPPKPLTEALVRSWVRGMAESEKERNRFMIRRGLAPDILERFELGYDIGNDRYVIPIRDQNGALMNVRLYKPDADVSAKMANWPGHGSPPRLFPLAVLDGADEVFVVEGELDALIMIQHGFCAVSGTGGAGRWDPNWSKAFEGKRVFISYDNDLDGRLGAKKAAKALGKYASEVFILPPLLPDEHKSDVTDYFLGGGTAEHIHEVMAHCEPFGTQAAEDEPLGAEPTTIEVIGSMDSTTNGKPLTMSVTVIGKKNPTFSVPRKVDLSCTMDAGPKCKNCPMLLTHEGDTSVEIMERDVAELARLIESPEDKRIEVMRKVVGAQKCNRLSMRSVDQWTVEELFVANTVEHRSTSASDFTQRRLYNIGQHQTKENSVARIVGTTHPNVKDARNEFFSWDLQPANTSIDSFQMTPEIMKQLRIFQTHGKQRPEDKARSIAEELSVVTGIIGRERLQVAMDLVWHSALAFKFNGKMLARGWLEFIVVGDTRTGKSETAIRLSEYYGLGHVIGCESATFAGLVGGVKQIGDKWTITWGEIPINDRRLVILDEFAGLSYDIISQLSDIRVRGVAQVTKVETSQTLARCRMIAIANQRKSKFIDEKKTEGVDIIQDVVGNEEDIARFDFAMSVRSSDVPSSKINKIHGTERTPQYTSEACHNLILWAWSRRPDQIVWGEGVEQEVVRAAEWLGDRYIESPPLLQVQSSREKVARMSVALAARVFSTDQTGELVVVKKEHVRGAVGFLHKLYSYDNFGYRRLSERVLRNRAIARSKRDDIKRYLRENPRLLEFLLDKRGSFRAQDLEEMAFMGRDEVNMTLGRLSDAKMISKSKSQIVIEPELQDLLKDIEREMR